MAFWDITKTGRLKKPKCIGRIDVDDDYFENNQVNAAGQPLVKVGDYVTTWGITGVSAGTVGKVTRVYTYTGPGYNGSKIDVTPGMRVDPFTSGFEYERLDGTVDSTHLWYGLNIPYQAVQEVKDFTPVLAGLNELKLPGSH